MFIAHIGAIDTFALALRKVAVLVEAKTLQTMVDKRYQSYTTGIGAKIVEGKTSFAELESFVIEHGEPENKSGEQEKYESIFNRFVYN